MSALDAVRGRILDVDSHEYIPSGLWATEFGAECGLLADFWESQNEDSVLRGRMSIAAPVKDDLLEISESTMETAWQSGSWAPSAIDMTRRPELLDFLGVSQQMIFPNVIGTVGLNMLSGSQDWIRAYLQTDLEPSSVRAIGCVLLEAWNRWVIETASLSPRLWPVGLIDTTEISAAVAQAEHLLKSGVRAIGVASGNPPGGLSPGHPDVDELWGFFETNDVPLVLHGGGDFGFLHSKAWADYLPPDPTRLKVDSVEVPLDPYSWCQLQLGAQNYVIAMIFGGVLERFPRLRVGLIENGAYWVGPTAENMGNVGRQFRPMLKHLSLTPAEYFQRNIRTSAFWWEPVDQYVERYGLEDVYVYGSDYPHFEGGKDPANRFATALERVGPDVMEKFFVKNAELLMP